MKTQRTIEWTAKTSLYSDFESWEISQTINSDRTLSFHILHYGKTSWAVLEMPYVGLQAEFEATDQFDALAKGLRIIDENTKEVV